MAQVIEQTKFVLRELFFDGSSFHLWLCKLGFIVITLAIYTFLYFIVTIIPIYLRMVSPWQVNNWSMLSFLESTFFENINIYNIYSWNYALPASLLNLLFIADSTDTCIDFFELYLSSYSTSLPKRSYSERTCPISGRRNRTDGQYSRMIPSLSHSIAPPGNNLNSVTNLDSWWK